MKGGNWRNECGLNKWLPGLSEDIAAPGKIYETSATWVPPYQLVFVQTDGFRSCRLLAFWAGVLQAGYMHSCCTYFRIIITNIPNY